KGIKMRLISASPVGGTLDVDTQEEIRNTMQQLSANFEEMVSSYDMAHAPLVLGVHGRFQQAIADHGSFDLRTREAIALTVAVVHNCVDCQYPHTIGCRAAGWSPGQIN